MKRILIVDDQIDNIEIIRKFGQAKGYEIIGEVSPLKALEKTKTMKFDLIILDVMMDELNGFELAQRIRMKSDVKFLFLSAKIDINSRIEGLKLGAIDYIMKPFSLEELFLKVNNIVNLSNEDYEIQIDDLVFNIKMKRLICKGEEIKLTALCFDLLFLLCKNKGQIFSRKYLLEELWATQEEFSSRTVDSHVSLLRNCLKEEGRRIKTVRSKGYMYEKDEG